LSIENTETYDRSDEAVDVEETRREEVSEPKRSPSSPFASDSPEVDRATRLETAFFTNDLKSTAIQHTEVTASPPSNVGHRLSTDTVAQQVPGCDGSVEVEVSATLPLVGAQAKTLKSHAIHTEE
jgi:hypothetical protein